VCEQLTYPDDEENGEGGETSKLEGLASNGVDGGNSEPVSGNGTGADEDGVTGGDVVELNVEVATTTVADSLEDGGRVETETVESNIEEEPWHSSSEQDLAVPDLAVETEEVLEGGLGNLELSNRLLAAGDLGDLIGIALTVLARDVLLSIDGGLLDVAGNIEGVAGSLGNGEAVVEGKAGRDDTDTDESAPHLVDSNRAVASAGVVTTGGLERALKTGDEAQHDEGTTKLTETLHGEDSTHHGTAPLGGSELGGDDGRKRVVTTDTDTHEHTPEDDQANDWGSRAGTNERLSESRDNDEDQLKTVHLLTSNDIGKGTETKLSDDSTGGGRELDSSILGSGESALVVVPVDDTQHDGQEGHAEDVVGVREETGTGDQDGAHMVPAKGSLVDLRESEASALIGVFNVCYLKSVCFNGTL
jgi:hypothetical protein